MVWMEKEHKNLFTKPFDAADKCCLHQDYQFLFTKLSSFVKPEKCNSASPRLVYPAGDGLFIFQTVRQNVWRLCWQGPYFLTDFLCLLPCYCFSQKIDIVIECCFSLNISARSNHTITVIGSSRRKPNPILQDITDHSESLSISLLRWLDTDEWDVKAFVSAGCEASSSSLGDGEQFVSFLLDFFEAIYTCCIVVQTI